MDVSVIIINYNTVDLIINCVNSIFQKTENIIYEVIIVDNNSSDNSKIIINEKFGDKVSYISLADNIGFGRANNEGLKIAKGRNVFFLNPDTILINNIIKGLSNYLDEHDNVAVCGGNLVDINGAPNHSFRRIYPSIFSDINDFLYKLPERLLFGKNREFNTTSRPINVAYITGADLMIKRRIIDDIGGFNPLFFMYYEETELCWRIKKNGYDIVSLPNYYATHFESMSFTKEMNNTKIEMQEKGRSIFYRLCYSKFYGKLSECILVNLINLRIVILYLSMNRMGIKYWQARLHFLKKQKLDL